MGVYGFRNFLSKFRHHFRFSKDEIEASIISVLLLAFIVSFKDWGKEAFSLTAGLVNLLIGVIIVGIVLGVMLIVIKTEALRLGYRAEFKIWWYGLIIGLGVIFLSRGNIWILAPGGIFFHHLATHRLGWFRYGLNMKETGMTCMIGSLSIVFLAAIFRLLLFAFPESFFLNKALTVSIWTGLFSMLPIPPLNGSRIFFWSRLTFFFIFGTVVGASILLSIPQLNLFLTLILSLALGGIVWLIYLWRVES